MNQDHLKNVRDTPSTFRNGPLSHNSGFYLAGEDFPGSPPQWQIRMEEANVGVNGSVERFRLTNVNPLCSLCLQECVEYFGREDLRGKEFVNTVTSIIPQTRRLGRILLRKYPA